MLVQVRHQPFTSLAGFQYWRGGMDRLHTGSKVVGWPLPLVPYHQAQKVQRRFGELAAEISFMKPMHQIVRVGRWLQPGAQQRQCLGECIVWVL